MPDRAHNDPEGFSSDHDRLVSGLARLQTVEGEIENLRNWRHDVVAPTMMVIQAQQRTNAETIGKLADSVTSIVKEIQPLMNMPGALVLHRSEALDSAVKLSADIKLLQTTVESNRTAGAAGQMKLLWTIGTLTILGLCAIIGAQWAFISPLLSLKGH